MHTGGAVEAHRRGHLGAEDCTLRLWRHSSRVGPRVVSGRRYGWAGATTVILPVHSEPDERLLSLFDGLPPHGRWGRRPRSLRRRAERVRVWRGPKEGRVRGRGCPLRSGERRSPAGDMPRHTDPERRAWRKSPCRHPLHSGRDRSITLISRTGPERLTLSTPQLAARCRSWWATSSRSTPCTTRALQCRPAHSSRSWAPDGMVEAVEHPGRRFIVGVQWHPECLDADHPISGCSRGSSRRPGTVRSVGPGMRL